MIRSPTPADEPFGRGLELLEQAGLAALAALLVVEREVVQAAGALPRRRRHRAFAGWPAAHESAAAAYGSSPTGADVSSGAMPAASSRSSPAVGSAAMPGGLAGGLGEGREDVGRVVQLDQLGRATR